tara:strand:- start:547 stop:771 length:225 start_codon:yes stop_codon:yes gene_type:complete
MNNIYLPDNGYEQMYKMLAEIKSICEENKSLSEVQVDMLHQRCEEALEFYLESIVPSDYYAKAPKSGEKPEKSK